MKIKLNSPPPPLPPPLRTMRETWFSGLVETKESKEATKTWAEDSFEKTRKALNNTFNSMLSEEANIIRRSRKESERKYKKWCKRYWLFFIPYCITLSVLFYYIIFVWFKG